MNEIQREYNGLGQLTKEYQAVGGAVNTPSTPYVLYTYSFSASGSMNHSRLVSITYPNGRVVTYNYATGLADNISRLSSITDGATTLESYEYLGAGNVVKRAHPQPGVDLTYIKLTGESDGSAGDKYIGLDRFGRVIDQRWTTTGGTANDRWGYGYDRNFNRLYKENLLDSTRSELYAYDGLNQITSFSRGTLNGTKDGISGTASRTQSWDHDALGNFDSQTTDGAGQTRSHNKQNEITSVAGATTPTYDSNGNLTKDETGRTFKYDAWNRLVEVRDSGNNLVATFRYDAYGRRVREIRGSTTTDFYYSAAWQVLEERVGSAVKLSYVWSPVYVDALICRDRDTDGNGSLDERLYPVHDANFNVTALLDTSGNVVERFANDAFGTFVVLTQTWGSRASSLYDWKHHHQGLRYDAAAGSYHNRGREYSPTLARFFQLDPILFAAGDAHLYRYVGNGPTNATDPTGQYLLAQNKDVAHKWIKWLKGLGIHADTWDLGGQYAIWIPADFKDKLRAALAPMADSTSYAWMIDALILATFGDCEADKHMELSGDPTVDPAFAFTSLSSWRRNPYVGARYRELDWADRKRPPSIGVPRNPHLEIAAAIPSIAIGIGLAIWASGGVIPAVGGSFASCGRAAVPTCRTEWHHLWPKYLGIAPASWRQSVPMLVQIPVHMHVVITAAIRQHFPYGRYYDPVEVANFLRQLYMRLSPGGLPTRPWPGGPSR